MRLGQLDGHLEKIRFNAYTREKNKFQKDQRPKKWNFTQVWGKNMSES